jgi:hypothetical protein
LAYTPAVVTDTALTARAISTLVKTLPLAVIHSVEALVLPLRVRPAARSY